MIILALSVVITACSGSSNNDAASSSPAASSSAPAASSPAASSATASSEAPKEPVTLKVAAFGAGWAQYWQRIYDRFKEMNPDTNISVDIQEYPTGADYNKAIDVAFASNESIDVMLMHHNDLLPRKDAFLPLEPFAQARGLDLIEDYGPAMVFQQIDGKNYQLPYVYATDMMIYNKKMFEEAGVGIPDENWTWDDWIAAAGKLTSGSGADKVYGYSIPYSSLDSALKPAYGYSLVNGTTVTIAGDARAREAIELHKELFDKGISPDFTTYGLEKMDSRVLMAQGKAASTTSNYWVPIYMNQLIYNNGTLGEEALSLDWEYTFMPKLTAADTPKVAAVTYAYAFSIPAISKHPEEAFDFMRFAANDAADIIGVPPAYTKADPGIVYKVYSTFLDSKGNMHENLYPQDKIDRMLKVLKETIPAPDVYGVITYDSGAYNAVRDLFMREAPEYYLGNISLDDLINKVQTEGQKEADKFK